MLRVIKAWLFMSFVAAFVVLSGVHAEAQQVKDTAHQTHLELSGALGFGFDKVDVGVTTGGDTISISGGGGAGLAAGLGYGLSSQWDLDFHLGVQASVMTPSVSNADGSFTRSFLLATLKRKIPTSEDGQFKFGIGIGSYMGGELDVDTSAVPSGSHMIVKYDPAIGLHATAEFERFVGERLSFFAGLKMYFVTYKAKTATDNGLSVPVSFLNDEIRELNGNGMDFMVGIATYF